MAVTQGGAFGNKTLTNIPAQTPPQVVSTTRIYLPDANGINLNNADTQSPIAFSTTSNTQQ